MHLIQLNLHHFKNYEIEQIVFPGKITSFVGNNGAGKTNILDAIHYLSFCKSFFNVVDGYSIKHGQDQFSIGGKFQSSDGASSDSVHCLVRRNHRKVFKYNGKEVDRLADHIGRIPAVMVSPYDSILIDGGSEERRRYLDMVISQYDRGYLEDLIAYNRALIQRNALLKQMAFDIRFDQILLDPWDEQLAMYGERIYAQRQSFVEAFIPVFSALYAHLSDDAEVSGIVYLSQIHDSADYMTLLHGAIDKDRQARFSTLGVHKDDLQLTLAGVPVKRFGSQGQQKSFIVALKLAQFTFLHKILRVKPLLLLDDIFDKLDRNRIERLMDLVNSDQYGQIFITDTNAQRIETIFSAINADTHILTVSNGKINPNT
jgi:DNA replication and repair protein RecF